MLVNIYIYRNIYIYIYVMRILARHTLEIMKDLIYQVFFIFAFIPYSLCITFFIFIILYQILGFPQKLREVLENARIS